MERLLVRNGTVMSLDPEIGDRRDCDVLVEDGRIAAIGKDLDGDGAEIIDAGGTIVMPGLVNAHMHTWQTAIRGIAGDWTLLEYGRNMHAGLAGRFTPEDIYISTLVGALNQINSGITTLFDWCHNNPTPEHSDRAIDALLESGIRAVFGHGTPKPKLDAAGVPIGEHLHPEDEVRRIREERLTGDDDLVSLALCIRGTDLATYEATAADIRLAQKYGVIASFHIGGRRMADRKTKDGIELLSKGGLLGPHINSVHSNKLTDAELALLADAGASFTATPEVEMQMGHGLPVTGRVLALGRQLSIGIDVETNISSELLWAARFALQVQRGLDNAVAHQAGDEISGVSIDARQALAWVTTEGAKALRKEHQIGSLTLGKQADIVLVRATDLNLFPSFDPAETVLFQSNSMNVDTVIIGGRIMKRNGRLTVADIDGKKAKLEEAGRRVLHGFALAPRDTVLVS
jgi:cytosine/adenosine deaminase-related metal-dependent hydrolase